MVIAADHKTEIVKNYSRHEGDTGSPEVQIAIITDRVNHLNGHLQTHRHDHASRRGLVMMVGRRNRLLRFLARTNREAYLALIKRLGLRK